MAKLLHIFGVPHHPFTFLSTRGSQWPPGVAVAMQRWQDMCERLAAARPDVLIVVGSDHLNQTFMDNMPAFMLGKSPRAPGTFPYEHADWAIPHYDVAVDVDLATDLIACGFSSGVDLAYSDEFVLDHSFTLPLNLLRPDADIPIVPLFANTIAPPLPPPERFFRVGEVFAKTIEDLGSDKRVCAIVSGHLSLEVGGPRMMRIFTEGRLDPEFDARMAEILGMGDGDSATLLGRYTVALQPHGQPDYAT